MDNIDIDSLPYRKAVIGIIVDKNNHLLIAQLQAFTDGDWRFVGGGIEEGESPEGAIQRELFEELGTNKFEVIEKSHVIHKYDWPIEYIKSSLGKRDKDYRGQEAVQFLVKFTGTQEEIIIDKTELRKVRWVKYSELKLYFNFPNQRKTAEKTLKGFKTKLSLK